MHDHPSAEFPDNRLLNRDLEDLIEVEDELEQWNEDEDHWRDNPGAG